MENLEKAKYICLMLGIQLEDENKALDLISKLKQIKSEYPSIRIEDFGLENEEIVFIMDKFIDYFSSAPNKMFLPFVKQLFLLLKKRKQFIDVQKYFFLILCLIKLYFEYFYFTNKTVKNMFGLILDKEIIDILAALIKNKIVVHGTDKNVKKVFSGQEKYCFGKILEDYSAINSLEIIDIPKMELKDFHLFHDPLYIYSDYSNELYDWVTIIRETFE